MLWRCYEKFILENAQMQASFTFFNIIILI